MRESLSGKGRKQKFNKVVLQYVSAYKIIPAVEKFKMFVEYFDKAYELHKQHVLDANVLNSIQQTENETDKEVIYKICSIQTGPKQNDDQAVTNIE